MNAQEDIWLIILRSLKVSKKRFDSNARTPEGRMDSYDMKEERETEDAEHELQWLVMTIQGDRHCEQKEYEEAMKMYDSIGVALKRHAPPVSKHDVGMAGRFKSKLVDPEKINQAYEKGHGIMKNKSLKDILLELNIITHIELIDDYDAR